MSLKLMSPHVAKVLAALAGTVLRRIVGEPDFVALHALIDKELAL